MQQSHLQSQPCCLHILQSATFLGTINVSMLDFPDWMNRFNRFSLLPALTPDVTKNQSAKVCCWNDLWADTIPRCCQTMCTFFQLILLSDMFDFIYRIVSWWNTLMLLYVQQQAVLIYYCLCHHKGRVQRDDVRAGHTVRKEAHRWLSLRRYLEESLLR